MPELSRRKLLLSASGAIAALAVLAGFRLPGFLVTRQLQSAVNDNFTAVFGQKTHADPASRRFVFDYVAFLSGRSGQLYVNDMTLAFLQSSNLIEHHETGVDLEYGGLFDPYTLPCGNRLGANYAYLPQSGQ